MFEAAAKIDTESMHNMFIFWLLDNWKISSGEYKGDGYSFKNYPYMQEVAMDDFPFQVAMKSAQSGWSEIKVAKMLFRAENFKRNILYGFPAASQLKQFVQARVRTAIEDNDHLSRLVCGAFNLEQIQYAGNTLYFRGAQNRKQMISVDVSDLFLDEIDTYMDDGVVYLLNKRTGASKQPNKDYFSVPSLPGFGISHYYYGGEGEKGSDQREWYIKCESCGHRQKLDWEENVIDRNEHHQAKEGYEPNVVVICRRCKRTLNCLGAGEWVAERPSLSNYCHGYHTSKLFSPIADLNQMLLDSRNPLKQQEFWNSDLGLPFKPSGSSLTDDILDTASRGGPLLKTSSDKRTVAGIDVGKILNIWIAEPKGQRLQVVWVGTVKNFKQADKIMENFKVSCAVVDANPDLNEAMAFQEAHKGRVWLAWYPYYLEGKSEPYQKKTNYGVNINRTLCMTSLIDFLSIGDMLLPANVSTVKDFYKQMKEPVRALKEDKTGNQHAYFPRTGKPDHYFHGGVYCMIAFQLMPTGIVYKAKGLFNG